MTLICPFLVALSLHAAAADRRWRRPTPRRRLSAVVPRTQRWGEELRLRLLRAMHVDGVRRGPLCAQRGVPAAGAHALAPRSIAGVLSRAKSKETPMRAIFLTALAVAALPLTGTDARAAPWCAYYGTGSGTNCGFYTIEQRDKNQNGGCSPHCLRPPLGPRYAERL